MWLPCDFNRFDLFAIFHWFRFVKIHEVNPESLFFPLTASVPRVRMFCVHENTFRLTCRRLLNEELQQSRLKMNKSASMGEWHTCVRQRTHHRRYKLDIVEYVVCVATRKKKRREYFALKYIFNMLCFKPKLCDWRRAQKLFLLPFFPRYCWCCRLNSSKDDTIETNWMFAHQTITCTYRE